MSAQHTPGLDCLDFVVVNMRTGNAIAAFVLPRQALEYVFWLRGREGVHGPMYEIINAEGTPVIWHPADAIAIGSAS